MPGELSSYHAYRSRDLLRPRVMITRPCPNFIDHLSADMGNVLHPTVLCGWNHLPIPCLGLGQFKVVSELEYDIMVAAVSISSIMRLTRFGLMAQHMRQGISLSLFQVTDCHVVGVKALPESMLTYCELDH